MAKPAPRARHHTDVESLKKIEKSGAINPTILRSELNGVHVEVEPFGSPRPGHGGAAAKTGAAGEGAYVEFDLPDNAVATPFIGERNTAVFPTTQPFSIVNRNPKFVKVRRWWNLWYIWIGRRQ